jgi:3-deoxy-D-manno-octulosonic-acid transferase
MAGMTLSLKTVLALSRGIGLVASPFIRAVAAREKSVLSDGRRGHYPENITLKAPWDIWLHAVSVGEVAVARAVVDELLELDDSLKVIVSSFTATGFQHAEKLLAGRCEVIPAPMDLPGCVSNALKAIKPAVYATVETELWPNMLCRAQSSGVLTAILNGRISDRSFPSYRKIRGIVAPLLEGMGLVCALTDKYAGRFASLGADPSVIRVCGNAKYSRLSGTGRLSRPKVPVLRGLDGRKVWIAGSTRSGEEDMVIAAHKKVLDEFPDSLLFMAPRHMKNVEHIMETCDNHGMSSVLFSGGSTVAGASVCIVDVIGCLFDLYGMSDAAFVGGSLVPRGGQNVMEPAAWSRPVIHGPHMSNFEDARDALDSAGGSILVRNGDELADAVIKLLSSPDLAMNLGRAARKALEKAGHGAAARQAGLLLELLRQSA